MCSAKSAPTREKAHNISAERMSLLPNILEVKVKVKFTLEQATKAQRGSRGIPILFL
jgi:hypothetical protein